jgi:hypothetical protein
MADLMIGENNRLVRQDIISQNKGYKTSERYVPISTQEVLDVVKEREPVFQVVGWNNANVRKKEKDSYQKHAMMIKFPDAELIPGTSFNLVLFNSHDRSMSFRILGGAIRSVCNNGMVWSDGSFEEIRIRHTNKEWKHSIYSLMDSYRQNQENIKQTINEMQNRYMSYGDQGRFAERVAEEIINPNITGSLIDPLEMLIAQRKEDIGKNLWLTYQRIQEYTLQGGLHRIIEKTDRDDPNNPRLFEAKSKTHKITDTTKQIDINRQLHKLALEYI